MNSHNKYQYIVSACLCGEKCRYDGNSNLKEKIKNLPEFFLADL